jgi:hypothetical protein
MPERYAVCQQAVLDRQLVLTHSYVVQATMSWLTHLFSSRRPSLFPLDMKCFKHDERLTLCLLQQQKQELTQGLLKVWLVAGS